jgi:hypothetical protein
MKNITFKHFLVIQSIHSFIYGKKYTSRPLRLYLGKCFQYDQATWTTNIFVTFTMGVNNGSIRV